MREAVINAVIHRDYARQTSTQIRVYHDRITIRNPAELPVNWSVSATGGMLSEPHLAADAAALGVPGDSQKTAGERTWPDNRRKAVEESGTGPKTGLKTGPKTARNTERRNPARRFIQSRALGSTLNAVGELEGV